MAVIEKKARSETMNPKHFLFTHGIQTRNSRLFGRPLTAALSCMLAACQPPTVAPIDSSSASLPIAGKAESKKVKHSLALRAFNYTDLPIASYTVDGAGGGDVGVSNERNGGSGTTCCGRSPASLPTSYTVSWSRDDHLWCEIEVPFNGPIPDDPQDLNTHFYRDGHVEISITNGDETPRIKMKNINSGLTRTETGNAIFDDKFAKCKNAI